MHLEQANGAWHGVQNHTAIRYSPAGCSILAKVVICHNLYRVTVSSSLMNPWNPSSVGKRLANRLLSMTLLSSLAVSVRGTIALAATRNEAFSGGMIVVRGPSCNLEHQRRAGCNRYDAGIRKKVQTGRPCDAQDTGFVGIIETGQDSLSFNDLDEPITGIAELESSYEQHAMAACGLAETDFGSDMVLTNLIEPAMDGKGLR